MKPVDTDRFILTREVQRELNERLLRNGDCLIYQAEPGTRHMLVRMRARSERGLISVSRLAYALANVHDHVGANEMVVPTCGHHGDGRTGQGTCCEPTHLRKVPYDPQRNLRHQPEAA